MIAYKFLRAGGIGPFSRYPWPLPAGGAGAWVEAGGHPRVCERAVHACRVEDLPAWLDAELWRIELDGAVDTGYGKLAAPRGRLLDRVAAWTTGTAADYAAACADRARERAVAALRRAGDLHAADLVEAATTADQLRTATRPPADASTARRAASFAVDAASYAEQVSTRPTHAAASAATAAYIAVTAAIHADGEGAAGTERAWQAAWLADRLGLVRAGGRAPR